MKASALVIIVLSMEPSFAAAQRAQRIDPSSIVSDFATTRGPERALVQQRVRQVLESVDGAQPRSSQDVLADGLVRIALSKEQSPIRADAVTMLGLSARKAAYKPYAGALDHLLEIYRGAPDAGIQSVALYAIAGLGDRTKALNVLAEVARDPKPRFSTTTEEALRAIALHGGEEGKVVLRRMYDRREVATREGQTALEFLKRNGYEYPRPPK